ncbi:hypothetical protein LTS17_008546 [Exophiala oligosperma]
MASASSQVWEKIVVWLVLLYCSCVGDQDNDDDDDDEEELDVDEAQKNLPSLDKQILSSHAECSQKETQKKLPTLDEQILSSNSESSQEQAQEKVPPIYEQFMSSLAEFASQNKAQEATVNAVLEALEAHRESLARSRAAAVTHKKLQRELMAVLDRVKDKPARARRAMLAREHQRLLASETLAAARGHQSLRPTTSAARVKEQRERESWEKEEVVLAAAAAADASASAPPPRPWFNLGTDPGWMGDLERMQIQVLRVGGRDVDVDDNDQQSSRGP